MVLTDSTPADFGRVAAQTAKQVILQRLREAERDAQYEEFIEREGDMVHGTVHSITPQAVTVGLGRAEALLPRNQQIPGEPSACAIGFGSTSSRCASRRVAR